MDLLYLRGEVGPFSQILGVEGLSTTKPVVIPIKRLDSVCEEVKHEIEPKQEVSEEEQVEEQEEEQCSYSIKRRNGLKNHLHKRKVTTFFVLVSYLTDLFLTSN